MSPAQDMEAGAARSPARPESALVPIERAALPVPTAYGRRVPPPLPPHAPLADARAAIQRFVGFVGPALGNVFLIPHPWIGMLLWAAIAWHPRHAAFALLGLAVATAGQYALGVSDDSRIGGGLKANALLAAVAAGWMTEPTIYPLHVQIAIATVVAGAAFVIAATIKRALQTSEYPSLLWGYCLTAGSMFAVFPVGTMMASQRLQWWQVPPDSLETWLSAFCRSIGSLLFAPSLIAGAAVCVGILLWSRAAFTAGVVGWIAGAGLAVGIQNLGVTYYWLPAAHNFFVGGMALGAFFILPGVSSLLLAAAGGAAAALVDIALQGLVPGFAYLPIASALTVWAGVGTLALAGDQRAFWRNRWPEMAPEEAWWRDALWTQRFGRGEPLLVVPVAGPVQVAQGFDGGLSHRKHLRHALDFVRLPEGSADVEHAPSIWKAAVTAPASGYVERVVDSVPDNPLGISNYAESWGNYVVIRLDQGGWALLAHFKQWTIAVRPGARIEIGTYLGLAGNSGRSPVPHVHMQVQGGPSPGAPTIPFRLANFRSATSPFEPLLEWNAARVPEQGTLVMASPFNPPVHATLSSMAPGTSVWTIEQSGDVPRPFREKQSLLSLLLEHRLDEWGRSHFTSGDGHLTAVLAPDAWRVVDQGGKSPLLRLLAHGTPSVPFAAEPAMAWTDLVPSLPMGLRRYLALRLAPYRLQPFLYARPCCQSVPGPNGGTLVVETALMSSDSSLPTRITCIFERIAGPVRVEAKFATGKVVYSRISFSPGQIA